MEKMLREISRFFVAPRRVFAPAVRARPRTPFSINTFTSVVGWPHLSDWAVNQSVA